MPKSNELSVIITGDGSDLKAELADVEKNFENTSVASKKATESMVGGNNDVVKSINTSKAAYDSFVSQRLSQYKKENDSHKTAMGRISSEWTEYKRTGINAMDGVSSSTKKTVVGIKKISSAINGVKFKKFESHAVKSMGNVALAAAAATAVMVAYSVKASADFQASVSDLSAITGATGDQLSFLSDKALEFGASTTLTASQSAEAMKLIASAKPDLLDNAQALSEVTLQTIKLAEASGVDLANAADTVGSSLNQFGAESNQAARFVNVLAAGSKFGSANVAQMSEALKVSGTVAKDAGLSYEQTNAAIQLMANVAIKGSEAGTGLRAVLLKLSTQSNDQFNPTVVGLSNALKNLKNAHLDASQKVKLFGQESITSANALINQADKLDILTIKLTGTNTATEQASIRNANLTGDVKRAQSAFEALAITSGDVLNPTLRVLTQGFTELITESAASSKEMGRFKNSFAIGIAQVADIAGNAANGISLPFTLLGKSIALAMAELTLAATGDFTEAINAGKAGVADLKKTLLDASDPAIAHRFENIAKKMLKGNPVGKTNNQPDSIDPSIEKNAKASAKKQIAIYAKKFSTIAEISKAASGTEKALLRSALESRIATVNADEARQRKTTAFTQSNEAKKNDIRKTFEQKRIAIAEAIAVRVSKLNDASSKSAMASATRVIDIHSAKFAKINAMGAVAGASEQDKLKAALKVKLGLLSKESTAMIEAANLQGANTDNIRAYFNEKRITEEKKTADKIKGINNRASKSAMASATNVIDIHSAKFSEMNALGAAAGSSEQEQLKAGLAATLAALDAKASATINAANLQGANTDNIRAFFNAKKVKEEQNVADKIKAINTKVIDIHSAKFAKINAMGAVAFASEQEKLQAGLDAKMAMIDTESTATIAAAELQGADTGNLRAYFDELRINAAQTVADRIGQIEDDAAATRKQKREEEWLGKFTWMEETEQQGFDLKSQFSRMWAGDHNLKLSSMIKSVQDFAAKSIHWAKWTATQKLQYTASGLNALAGLLNNGSRKGFEASKKVNIASATMSGITSAVAAWKAGMEVGGPFAPVVAAGYTAMSLAKTGAMIQRIKSQSFGGGGGSVSAGGGASVSAGGGGASYGAGNPAPVPQAQQKPIQQIQVNINGVISQDQLVNEIIPLALQHQVNNNDLILINQNSANAQALVA